MNLINAKLDTKHFSGERIRHRDNKAIPPEDRAMDFYADIISKMFEKITDTGSNENKLKVKKA